MPAQFKKAHNIETLSFLELNWRESFKPSFLPMGGGVTSLTSETGKGFKGGEVSSSWALFFRPLRSHLHLISYQLEVLPFFFFHNCKSQSTNLESLIHTQRSRNHEQPPMKSSIISFPNLQCILKIKVGEGVWGEGEEVSLRSTSKK